MDKKENRGQAAIAFFDSYFKILLGDADKANIYKSWIAHTVQYPGKIIGWVPFIVEPYGIGNSAVDYLIRRLLGNSKVSIITKYDLKSGRNSWSKKIEVGVILLNRLTRKCVETLNPLITAKNISVPRFRQEPYMIENKTNYFGFVNRVDDIPVELRGRRWWIQKTPMKSHEEFKKRKNTYFNPYDDFLNDEDVEAEVREHYLTFAIPECFYQYGQAQTNKYEWC